MASTEVVILSSQSSAKAVGVSFRTMDQRSRNAGASRREPLPPDLLEFADLHRSAPKAGDDVSSPLTASMKRRALLTYMPGRLSMLATAA